MITNAYLKSRPARWQLRAFFDALVSFKEINNNQAAIYRALISFNGREGCFPSHATLAAESGVCERTVRNALREARLRGWIDWTNERYGRRQSSNRYRFLISNDYINKVLSGIKRFKRKTATISEFFRRQNLPGSPYYYIKQEAKRLWISTKEPRDRLSPFQELFLRDRDAAIRLLTEPRSAK